MTTYELDGLVFRREHAAVVGWVNNRSFERALTEARRVDLPSDILFDIDVMARHFGNTRIKLLDDKSHVVGMCKRDLLARLSALAVEEPPAG